MSTAPSALPRLSLMMFLQYAVWGAWLPLAARYLSADTDEGGLGFGADQIGMILGLAGSVGAVASPFIAGQVADRWFATQRFMALLLIAGGGVQWQLAQQTGYTEWLWLSVAYSVLYMPTLALSNSLAFTHMEDEARDFPRVRLWGTIGWIAASWTFPMIWLQTDLSFSLLPPFLTGTEVAGATGLLVESLRFSAGLSVVYGLYCLVLPHTPPRAGGAERVAFAAAFRLLARPSFAVLVGVSLLISVIHNIYFLQTPPFLSSLGLADSHIGPAMTIGQFSEIVVMLLLGLMLKRLGFRGVITLGALAYVLRYGIWALPGLPLEVVVVSQALHGVCYACFFAAAFIYVDRIAPEDIRHSAQTVFGILILGGGPVLGGWLSGRLSESFSDASGLDYGPFWTTLAGIALAATLLFVLLFRDETREAGSGADP